jgi:hypothetical protein
MRRFGNTFIIFLVILTLTSCREEIIPPNNPSGNLNHPVKESALNSYSFIMNAADITYNIYDYIKFDNNRTQVFISILDYSKGSVELSLLSKSKRIIFNKTAAADISGEYSRLSNEIPDAVVMNFKDFTGKIKLTLSRY